MAKEETELENTESKAPALSQEEFEFISKDQAITQEQKAKGIAEFKEQAKPVFKAAEERMVGTDGRCHRTTCQRRRTNRTTART